MTGKSKKTASKKPARKAEETRKTNPKAGEKSASGKIDQVAEQRDMNTKLASLTDANRQLRRKIFDLYTVFEISRNFNAVLHYETLLDTFILTSLAQVGASKAAIFLTSDKDSRIFKLAQCKGMSNLSEDELGFGADSKLTELMSKLNRPEPTGEILKKITDDTEVAILKKFHPGLVVPLNYQTRLSGLFMIADKMSGREFQLDDIEFLSILGSQISVAIENARLYKAELNTSRQLQSAQQQLVLSERLAALGEMSAKIAHEINNPLGIIKNYLLLVKRSTGRNVEATNYLDIVGQEIDRIAGIVRELLDFHRPLEEDEVEFDICKTIDEVLTLMERKVLSQGIELRKAFPDSVALIKGAPENIKQVMMNLLINSIDVLPRGGWIRVGVELVEENARITVCDSGPGIEPDLIPRIFEPFFTTKEPGKGTGLGLSVCYGIIKRHKGSITFRNIKQGGCFEILLPITLQGNG